MSCCAACGQHGCACGCGARVGTPLPLYNRPGLPSLAYRVGTYADFHATMQANLSDADLSALAGLRTREADDPAMALLDAWAVGADVLTFYQERIANEGYLRTASERRSVLELARLVDYRVRPGVAASVYLAYTVEKDALPVTIDAGARAQSIPAPGEQMQAFETSEPLEARYEWNALKPRLTRPANISVDNIATLDELWIADPATGLKANDRLLFLFGNLATGVQALRFVQSAEPDQEGKRSRVVLQPMLPSVVEILRLIKGTLERIEQSVFANRAAQARSVKLLVEFRKRLLLADRPTLALQEFQEFRGHTSDPMLGPIMDAFFDAVTSALGFSRPPPTRDVGGFRKLFQALKASPTLQPANRLRLQRTVAGALGVSSDARPQLLLNFETRLASNLYPAWASLRHGRASPTLSGVFALRLSAPLFGYNAPFPMVLALNQDEATKKAIPYVSQRGTDWKPEGEQKNHVQLDNAYEGVLADSYLVIERAGRAPMVAQAERVRVHPRTNYGISGKTTDIELVNPSNDDASSIWPAPEMATVRTTQVYAQSEALPLAEERIAADVGNDPRDAAAAKRMTLDTAIDGLKAGRWAIVEGQRTDVPGADAVSAAELVMIEAVEQKVDTALPGDTVHSTLVFAKEGLAYRYKRDTVTLHANVAHATHGETRREVLGSGDGAVPMQAFVLKQSPLTHVSDATPDGVRSTLTVRVNDLRWHEARNLAFAEAADRAFVTMTDEDGKTRIVFGDGVHGARLPTGIENVKATYRSGIGTSGNARVRQISLLATKPLGIKDVINPLRASGGADPETRDQARRNVPLAVLALDRLVSVPDYADFARTFGGVGKAVAKTLGDGVHVTIAGAGDAPIDPSSDLHRNLLEALRRHGDPNLAVQLDVRELLALTLSAKVGLQPDEAWEFVEPRVRAALLDAFGFERRELAQNVYRSEVIACIQAVRGVAWVDIDAFGSLDEDALLAGFGNGDDNDDKVVPPQVGSSPVVQVLPARLEEGEVRAAQIAYLLANVPDTVLLQEATA
jgi:predicted phage baseplate assembly protein